MGLHSPLRRRALVPAAIGALVLSVAAGTPARASTVSPPSTTPEPTVQMDGVAFAQVVVGDTVYVGGKFSKARPAGASSGSDTSTRTNLLAYDLNSGKLKSWAPTTDQVVDAMVASSDGKTLYIGGDFTKVDGSSKSRIAAISTSTGKIVSGFKATVNKTVSALSITGSRLYAGGEFTSADDSTRLRVAAFSPTTGSLSVWAPKLNSTDSYVYGIVSDDDAVVLGGKFTTVNGKSAPGSAEVDSSHGTSNKTWHVNEVVKNSGDKAAIYSLSTDGIYVYGSGYQFGSSGSGRLEGFFKATWSGGTIKLLDDCHGDTYSVAPEKGGPAFTAGHAHDCSNIGGFGQTDPEVYRRGLEFQPSASGTVQHNTGGSKYSDFAGQPAAKLVDWYPYFDSGTATGQDQGPWNVVITKDWVLYAGEFTKVGPDAVSKRSPVAQQGLVRFKR